MAEYKNPLDGWLAELPEGTELSRRAWLEVKYTAADGGEETDISEDIGQYLLSFSCTDNLSDTADDIVLTLEDRAQLWLEDWYPEGEGNLLDIAIHTYNRIALHDSQDSTARLEGGESVFHVGKFEIDEIEITGFPSTVQIKGVSVLGDTSLRGTKKNQTWEDISVWKCAADICERNGLALFWDCAENPNLDHVEQADESDLEFMQKICHDHGMSLKISTEQVIIFDDAKYETQDPVVTVYKPGVRAELDGKTMPLRWVTDYGFRAKTRDTYWKCHVKYQKGKDKETIEGEFSDPGKEKGRVLYVREQVENVAEAEKLAKKKLREANKEQVTGHFATIGNTNLAAGQVVKMGNFGHFSGNYLAVKASHEIDGGSGSFVTRVEARRCLDGY